MAEKEKYIPALKFGFLTPFFDSFLGRIMPEAKFKETLINEARLNGHEQILDFGCGTGTLVIMLKKKYPDAAITGVDIDPNILKIAGDKTTKLKLDIRLDTYEGRSLPYPDNYFDKVMSSLVFHHLTSDQKVNVLKEIYRILKPGGTLHIGDMGVQHGIMMHLVASILRKLEPIDDNIKGLIPEFMNQAGFKSVREAYHLNTSIGTLAIYSGVKAR